MAYAEKIRLILRVLNMVLKNDVRTQYVGYICHRCLLWIVGA